MCPNWCVHKKYCSMIFVQGFIVYKEASHSLSVEHQYSPKSLTDEETESGLRRLSVQSHPAGKCVLGEVEEENPGPAGLRTECFKPMLETGAGE